jgi:hypothetical protein
MLKNFLEETISQTIDTYGQFSILEWSNIFLEYDNLFIDFPKVKEQDMYDELEEDEYDFEETYEILDFENFSILNIDFEANLFVFCAFGDWQNPTEISVTYDKDSIEFENLGICRDDSFFSDEEFLEKVYGSDWINELKMKYNYDY